MAIKNFFDGGKQVPGNDGLPLNGGLCYFYEPGTTTPKNTYTTSGLTVANANPVVLDAYGRANVWLNGNYRVIVRDSASNTIYDEDNINPEAGNTVTAISSNTTLDSTHNTNVIEVSGATTLTLTSAGTLGAGWYVEVRNVDTSNNVTIARANAGNTFNGVAASQTLRPLESMKIVVNASANGFITTNASLPLNNGAINPYKGADIASASTTDIGAATGNFVDVTGTVTITALGTVQAGTYRKVRFTGTLTLTHNATSLILPGRANITTQPDDVAEFISLGSGNWVCTDYQRKSGFSVRNLVSFTATGSFTAEAPTFYVTACAGGGGGGAANSGAGTGGGGGGGGEYCFRKLVSGATVGTAYDVTIGAGGAASGAGGNTTISSSLLTLNGGSQGSGASAGAGGTGGDGIRGIPGGSGAPGAGASGGGSGGPGGPGWEGRSNSGNGALHGASGLFGRGGDAAAITNVGGNATGFGAGGAGGSGGSSAGGTGSPGFVLIEYA